METTEATGAADWKRPLDECGPAAAGRPDDEVGRLRAVHERMAASLAEQALHGALPAGDAYHAFDIEDAVTDPASALLVVVSEGAERYALLVDELLGQQQFVAKPLADGIAQPAGRVGLIIDPAGLLAGARARAPWLAPATVAG